MLSSWFGMVLVLIATGEYSLRLVTRRAAMSTRGYDWLVLFGMLVAGTAVTFHHAPVWRFGVAAVVGVSWFVITRSELRFRHGAKGGPGPNVGDPLPEFAARTSAGEPFAAKDLLARAPAMLVVYRGHW